MFYTGRGIAWNAEYSADTEQLQYYRSEIYRSYIRNDMHRWRRILDSVEQRKALNDEWRLFLVNIQYGYIAWCISSQKPEMAERYLERARAHLLVLETNGRYPSEVQAYQSAFYGFEIGLNLWKAPFLGPKSVSSAKTAMRLDPQNPMGYVQYANALYFRPAIFGGSKKEAIDYYRQARILMENQPENIRQNWNYLNLMVLLARAYEETNQLPEAGECYEHILKVEPGFFWVKNELYPQYRKKIRN